MSFYLFSQIHNGINKNVDINLVCMTLNLRVETSKSDFVSKKSIGGCLWVNQHLNEEDGYQRRCLYIMTTFITHLPTHPKFHHLSELILNPCYTTLMEVILWRLNKNHICLYISMDKNICQVYIFFVSVILNVWEFVVWCVSLEYSDHSVIM